MRIVFRRYTLAAALLFATSATFAARVTAQTTVTLPLEVTGEVRVRSEADRVPGASSDLFTYLRSRLGVRVTAAPGIRVMMQVQDSRVMGSEGVAAASAADVFELHQGYLEIERHHNQRQLDLRAGRQEITFSNERLIGVSNWTNLGRSFDGFRLTLTSDTIAKNVKWSANAFAATVEERGRHFGTVTNDPHPTDRTVAGIFAMRDLQRNTKLEGLLLYDGASKYRRFKDSDRATLYGRARTDIVGGFHADMEAASQFGHQSYSLTDTSSTTSQEVRAWMVGARLSTPTLSAHKLVLTIGTDILSGDATPTDKQYSAFSTEFASNHSLYGLLDVIGDPSTTTHEHGIVDALATAVMVLGHSTSLRAEAHHFEAQAAASRPLGNELDIVLPMRIGTAANLEFGYAAFRAESGATVLGLGANHSTRQWAYLQLRAGF